MLIRLLILLLFFYFLGPLSIDSQVVNDDLIVSSFLESKEKIRIKKFTIEEKKYLQRKYEGTSLFATPQIFEKEVTNKSTSAWKKLSTGEYAVSLSIKNDNNDEFYLEVNATDILSHSRIAIQIGDTWQELENEVFNNDNIAVLGPYRGKELNLYQIANGLQKEQLGDGLTIERIYTDFTASSSMETGFGESHECNQNVACSIADNYEDQKMSVVRVLLVLEEGLGFCSGAFINNARNDFTPYLLSGFHCQEGFTPIFDRWRFDFGYSSESCANPEDEPNFRALSGCRMVSGRQESDFLLLELLRDIPSTYPVYFSGWDRRDDYHPEPSVMIHHPAGDIKKISIENDELRILQSGIIWDNEIRTPEEHHFISNLDIGTQEAGSSGSPLFDEQGNIIGQLHGGATDEGECDQTRAYYGRLEKSWNDGETPDSRLRDWLDPDNRGVESIGGLSMMAPPTVTYEIQINDPLGNPVDGVKVDISGDISQSMITDNGVISLTDQPAEASFSIQFEKKDNPWNGISALDLVQLRRHILGLEPFEDEIQLLAADANNSGSTSVTDAVHIQNILLGLWDAYPELDSWEFLPDTIQVDPNENPGTTISVIAYKVGDVNFSANPKN